LTDASKSHLSNHSEINNQTKLLLSNALMELKGRKWESLDGVGT
jgi:hypothetical protein